MKKRLAFDVRGPRALGRVRRTNLYEAFGTSRRVAYKADQILASDFRKWINDLDPVRGDAAG
jgi:hypothetical protein